MCEPTTTPPIDQAACAVGDGHNLYTYYDILQIPPSTEWNLHYVDELKRAYRRALLVHHPDKIPNTVESVDKSNGNNKPQAPSLSTQPPNYSIDEITTAYKVLSNANKRAAYDEALRRNETDQRGQSGTHIGVEVFDLEDMAYDDDKEIWSRSCRCGDERGYMVAVDDLEKESQHGEIFVGCLGCSLFIKVMFAVEGD
ncbi:hypothetical protein LTR84_004481 [Exophiala bonariae]|uniref:Diphthamide biosynthesis protein 4 n=1 Tax=Exophiala bonariae TaxID=1690606 RepID=A0AAV9N9C3_9EURO|nr:hypothetical protein LTR84_004481 [Exophiala bonariae]